MKIFVKTFVLILAPFAWASEEGEAAHEHLRRDLSIPDRELVTCPSGTPPDGTKSQIVELSYYDDCRTIDVTITAGIPDKIFKFSGCSSDPIGTRVGISSCPLNSSATNPVFSLWTRDALNYNLKECVDTGYYEPTCSFSYDDNMFKVIAYKNEETVYFKPGVHDGAGDSYVDGTYRFTFCVDPNWSPQDVWPCFPTFTATYVHGSTEVDFDAGVNENIKADFFYTGEFDEAEFDVVIFADQTCTKGNEIAGTAGTPGWPYTKPPFDVSIDPFGLRPTEYDRVTLKANHQNWVDDPLGYWDESFGTNPATGRLAFCLQFQVKTAGGNVLEFVDVAYTIDIDLVQECACNVPGAVPSPPDASARDFCTCPCPVDDPTCGVVILIRDEITGEELEVDPNIPMKCGPCGGDTTVTQGESFPVCMTLVNDTDAYCIEDATVLKLTVERRGTSATYTILPSLQNELLAGPLVCDTSGECVIQIIAPGDLIRNLEAGNPDDNYVGRFSGAALLGVGSCDDRRRGRELRGAVFAAFVGQEFSVKIEPKPAPKCRDGPLGFFCRLLERIRSFFKRN